MQYWSYDAWWLHLNINGKTHLLKEPPKTLNNGKPFNAYVSGQNVTLTFKVEAGDYANKIFGVDGVHGIPDSSSDEWRLISPNISPLKHYQVFRDMFTDEGSFAHDGMRWFFLDKYKNDPGRSQG